MRDGAAVAADPREEAVADDVRRFLAGMPFIAALGVEVMSAAPGTAALEAPLSPAFEAPPGAFAASSIGALGDVAALMSAMTLLPAGWSVTTLDFTAKMHARTEGDRLRAVGRALNAGRTICVGQADVFVRRDGGWRSCATVLATGRSLRPAAG